MGNQLDEQQKPISRNIIDIYTSFRQAHRDQLKNKKRNRKKSFKTLQQFLEPFKICSSYPWSSQIIKLFNKYFVNVIEQIALISKQEFYKILLINAGQKNIQTQYEDFFYEEGPGKQKKNKNMSLFGQEGIRMINSSILDASEFFPQYQNKFVSHQKALSQYLGQYEKSQMGSQESKIYRSQYNQGNIQNSSVIIPDTIFIDRLDEQAKLQINELVSFYKNFGNTLQQIINSSNLISLPLKHFDTSLKDKLKRKKIKKSPSKQNSNLLSDKKQYANIRRKRQYNNSLLIIQVRDFTEAYTNFLWSLLELDQIQQTHLGAFININSMYNIVLKNVWNVAGWIGERGFQWQQYKLLQILDILQLNKSAQIPQKIAKQLQQLRNENNPQRYLKRIVIFYREIIKLAYNADNILILYQKAFYDLIKKKRHWGILRMSNIVEKVVKIDENNGQICYAWTTWKIIIEMLKKKIYEYAILN